MDKDSAKERLIDHKLELLEDLQRTILDTMVDD